MDIRNAPEVQRREDVPPQDRTEGRDAAADWIEEHIVDAGRWPMTYSDIADECNWSRQHITAVLRTYFEPAKENGTGSREVERVEGTIEIDIPEHTKTEDYLRGWVDGYLHWAQENNMYDDAEG